MSKTSQPQSVSMPAAALTASASAVVAGDALDSQWQRVRARLRVSFGDAAFNSWLKPLVLAGEVRSEEHTSELQSLMRISYAVFCLKKKTHIKVGRCNRNNHTYK